MLGNIMIDKYPNRKYLIISFLVFAVFTAFFLPVFADSGTRGIQKVVENMIKDICSFGVSSDVIDILTKNIKTSYASSWGAVQSVVDNVILPVSYSVLGVYFITAIASWGMRMEGLTMEMIVRPFMYYIAAFLFVYYTPNIVSVCISAGATFTSDVLAQITSGATGNAAEMAEKVYGMIRPEITGFFPGFAKMMQLLLPWIISKLMSLFLQIIAYGIIIEIFVTGIFLPLSYGSVIQHGVDGGGFRFLKRFIALCCQAGAMLIIAAVGSQFATHWTTTPADFDGFLKGTATMLVAQGATAMLMLKSGELVRSAIGA